MIWTATAALAQPDDVWEKATAKVIRLPPSKIPGLPKAIAKEMKRRKCLIPQTYNLSAIHNAISGSFRKAGVTDWAALCSNDHVSSILVFWNGSTRDVEEVSSSPDKNWLQGVNENRIGFSRIIRTIGPADISQYQLPEEGQAARSFAHDGIEEAFRGKASTVLYYEGGNWTAVTGAD